MSPTFYEQLLHTKIPKAQKDTDDLTVFLRFWDLHMKTLCINMLIKSTLGVYLEKIYTLEINTPKFTEEYIK